MLRAVVEQLGEDHELVVEPWIGPYGDRARLGLHQKLWLRSLGPAAGLLGLALPRGFRSRYGLVARREIDVILDASGYALGDPFGLARTRRLSADLLDAKRRGARVILLPQAFGPFEHAEIRDASRAAVSAADLVYARDYQSKEELIRIGIGPGKVHLAPDFTGSVGVSPEMGGEWTNRVAVVPNQQMVGSRTTDRAAYLSFLSDCILAIRDRGLEPVLVAHEMDRDLPIIDRLQETMEPRPDAVVERDPVRLKAMIGSSHAVVSGRYHALASALALGVPVLATGWSHKYRALLEEYGVPDAMADTAAPRSETARRIDALVDSETRPGRRIRLLAIAGRREAAVKGMWREVRAVIDERGQ